MALLSFAPMRIAVTGASGFVGRALCPALAARGHQVVALDRGAIGDMAQFSDWPRVLAGVDAVAHLAALAHRRDIGEERLRAINVEAPVAIGRAAAAAGVRMLFMSSVKAAGEETAGAAFGEGATLAPQDAYGRSKAQAEQALLGLRGLALTILRPPLVYGAGVKANFLALLAAVARGVPLPLASIENRRNLVYAGNLADAAARCLESPRARGKAYFVADGSPVSTPDLCRALGAALGRPARLFRFPPALLELAPPMRKLTRSLEVDDGAIRRELDWSPPCAFEEGIRLTAAWYRARAG